MLKDRKTIAGSVVTQLRKSIGRTELLRLLSGQLDPKFDDHVSSAFGSLKGTRAYWQMRREELIAMIQ